MLASDEDHMAALMNTTKTFQGEVIGSSSTLLEGLRQFFSERDYDLFLPDVRAYLGGRCLRKFP